MMSSDEYFKVKKGSKLKYRGKLLEVERINLDRTIKFIGYEMALHKNNILCMRIVSF